MKLVKTQVDTELKRLTPPPSKSDESAIKNVCSRVSEALGDGLPNAQMEARISQLVRDALAQYATEQSALRASVTAQLAKMEQLLEKIAGDASAAAEKAGEAALSAAQASHAAASAAVQASGSKDLTEEALAVAGDARRVSEDALDTLRRDSTSRGRSRAHGSSAGRRSRSRSRSRRSKERDGGRYTR
jgi:Tfp pilus assembly major pilin PilA